VQERWLPVVGYEGLYEVSDRGHVRGLDRMVRTGSRWGTESQRMQRGRILAFGSRGYGYWFVHLSRAGKASAFYVHRLVLEAFVGPCPEGMEALHGPGGRRDNRWPENLSWGTRSQNARDRTRDGTMVRGIQIFHARLNPDAVREIRRLTADGVSQREIARRFDVSKRTIGLIVRGETWAWVE
jgi:HNH endonuclease/NUMOD4 motif-containing protein